MKNSLKRVHVEAEKNGSFYRAKKKRNCSSWNSHLKCSSKLKINNKFFFLIFFCLSVILLQCHFQCIQMEIKCGKCAWVGVFMCVCVYCTAFISLAINHILFLMKSSSIYTLEKETLKIFIRFVCAFFFCSRSFLNNAVYSPLNSEWKQPA